MTVRRAGTNSHITSFSPLYTQSQRQMYGRTPSGSTLTNTRSLHRERDRAC